MVQVLLTAIVPELVGACCSWRSPLASWQLLSSGRIGILGDLSSWLAFQLPPAGGDAVFSVYGREKERGAQDIELYFKTAERLKSGVLCLCQEVTCCGFPLVFSSSSFRGWLS